jgi:hypothetical protein
MDSLRAAFETACARFTESNFDELDEVDRVLVTIWGLEAEVNNGGFEQFYFNSAGDLAFFAPTALRLIGANRMADIALQANAILGPDGPARSRTARQAQVFLVAPLGGDPDPWDELERAFLEYPDDISELLTRYLLERSRLT